MSAPAASLPVEVAELLYLTTCEWQAATSMNVYGDESYAAPVQLDCWIESARLFGGGSSAFRPAIGGTTDHTTDEPVLDLFFNGNDPNVRSFTLNDRFTPGEIGFGSGLKPRDILTYHGPNFDNQYSWLIVVTL